MCGQLVHLQPFEGANARTGEIYGHVRGSVIIKLSPLVKKLSHFISLRRLGARHTWQINAQMRVS